MVPRTVVSLPFGVMPLVIGVFLGSVWLMALNEKLWLATAVLALVVFVVRTSDGSFGVEELIYSVYGPPGLVAWFVREVVVGRRRLVHSAFDWLLLSSVLICLCVALISSLLHEAEMRFFIREFLGFFMVLIYFPMRKFLKNDRAVYTLAIWIVIVAVANGVINVTQYQERVIESLMAYGEVNARSTIYEHLSIVFVCICFAWITFANRWKSRLIGIGLFSFGGAVLVISLSRGPIVGAMAAILFGLLFVPFARIFRFGASFLLIVLLNLGVASLVFPSLIESIFDSIGRRAATMEQLSGDASLQSRILESKTLIERRIPASPVIGHGYGVRYLFYDLAVRYSHRTGYTHNGYLFPIYKFGIPAGLLLLFTLFSPLIRIPFSSYGTLSREHRMFLVGAVSGLVGLLVSNLTAQNLSTYLHLVIYAALFAVIDYVLSDQTIQRSRMEEREGGERPAGIPHTSSDRV